ncbi:hypothetical protein MKEN_01140000 [Mycena kentingensis (nom. inval.)]|nr:hypothetical protein MKEN_01140000 [Mycena kentingensis (nom. inval.)]
MFAENDSESPRVPSPWDTFISTPPSPSPGPGIPRLVPENDDGNVEYKLQLLSPSPGRFARLVTQMKWRLLEGGGQAYYELGVADSGMLVGLPRAELEQSLETLEMMAGEIGASVIVVKEIEVPAAMLDLSDPDALNGKRTGRRQPLLLTSDESTATNTETETELSATDVDNDELSPKSAQTDANGNGVATSPPHESDGVRAIKAHKAQGRRGARDRRREERRQALAMEAAAAITQATSADATACGEAETDALVHNLEELHVSVDPDPAPIPTVQVHETKNTLEPDPELEFDGEDDVFPSMITTVPGPFTGLASTHLTVPNTTPTTDGPTTRLIVEALVVRKMSIEEAFLDFGGAFSLS